MEKIHVGYESGMSASIPEEAVDYMVAYDPEWDDILYAELPAQEDEDANYEDLKAEILAQAKEAGIPAESLIFWFDEE